MDDFLEGLKELLETTKYHVASDLRYEFHFLSDSPRIRTRVFETYYSRDNPNELKEIDKGYIYPEEKKANFISVEILSGTFPKLFKYLKDEGWEVYPSHLV